MVFLRNVLRFFSWIFETILCVLALAVAGAVVVLSVLLMHYYFDHFLFSHPQMIE